MSGELRDAVAGLGPEALALFDTIVAEHVERTKLLLTAERPSFEPPSRSAGYDANGSPVED